MNDRLQPDPTCPRCGYDQRGLIAAWLDTCPLEATCTECGLTYRSADLLVPEKFEPKWCIEHCPRGIAVFLRSCIATLGRSFLPWRFWSRLKMSDRMQPRRIVLYVCLMFVPLLLILLSAQWAAAVRTWNHIHADIADQVDDKRAEIGLLRSGQIGNIRGHAFVPPQRTFAYHRMSPEERAEYDRVIEVQIEAAQAFVDNPPDVKHSFLLAILEAIALPLAQSSFGAIVNPDGTTVAYPSPVELWSGIEGPWDIAPPVFPGGATTLNALIVGLLVFLTFPLTLVLVPVSRRRAKVRWAHIWRIAAYGAFIPMLALVLAMLLLVLSWSGIGGSSLMVLHSFAAVWFIPCAIATWWTFAIGRYMKVPHGFWIGMLHTIIALGVVLSLSWICVPGLLFAY